MANRRLSAHIPNGGFVTTRSIAGQNLSAIWRKGYRPNPAVSFIELEQFLAAGRIPNSGKSILAARDDLPAVRGKDSGHDQVVVLTEGDHCLAACHVPH